MSTNDEVRMRALVRLRLVVREVEELITDLPSLTDISDADMALMYLRHIEKHVKELQ